MSLLARSVFDKVLALMGKAGDGSVRYEEANHEILVFLYSCLLVQCNALLLVCCDLLWLETSQ